MYGDRAYGDQGFNYLTQAILNLDSRKVVLLWHLSLFSKWACVIPAGLPAFTPLLEYATTEEKTC